MTNFQRTFNGLNSAALVVLLFAIAGCGTGSSPSDTVGLDSTQPIDAISDNGYSDVIGDNTIHDINPTDPGSDNMTTDNGIDSADAESEEVTADVPHDEIDEDTLDNGSFDTETHGFDIRQDTGPTDVHGTDLWVEPAPSAILVELFSDDFENSETATLEDPWFLYPNSGVIDIFETQDYAPGSKVLRLIDTTQPGVSPSITRPFNELRDNLTDTAGSVSFDISGNGEAAYAYVLVGNMTISFMRIDETGFFRVYLSGDSSSTRCTDELPLDTWVNVSLRTDWPNSSADLLIDGIPTDCMDVDMEVEKGTQFPTNFKVSTVNKTNNGSETVYTGGTFMIDNIVFPKIGETDVTRHGVTGQMWQKIPPARKMSFDQGSDFCAGLTAPRGLKWRLPTIDELRTLVEDCPYTVTDGGCGVSESCAVPNNCRAPACDGCATTKDCYWFGKMGGSCVHPYLSSTLSSQITKNPWWLHFRNAYVGYEKRNGWVRCVLDYAR